MRIDSGQSNYYYQSRFLQADTDGEEAASEAATTSRPRSGSSVSVGTAHLSSSLASALWVIEGGRKTAGDSTGASPSTLDKAAPEAATAQIEALYLENSAYYDD